MNKDIAVFAETTFRNKYRKFGIKTDDRRRHMYLIGKTGMGKSTVLENMIVDDIRAGRGVAVVDPHGDLAEKVIKFIPSNRMNDVVYFNPADYEYPFAFNVLEQVDASQRHLVASGLVGVFQKLWADSWGPRLEYILRNTILAILDYPGSTLLGVTRMLSDKKFRKKVITYIEDPVVKAFWVNEFANYNDKFASEAVSPIQNKVGQFLSTALIRNIVGQTKSTIDMRYIMDQGKILILNLSKGRIGEDASSLLGNMIITKIQLAAMSRVDIPEDERRDFYLYIDEFQNFTTDSFANILSEARKYKLNLIMAHQYIEQMAETVKYAVFGNVGTLVVFRVGASDAEVLEPEFAPTFTEEDILNIPKYEFYLKLMIDGIASEPFSARGLPPMSKEEETGNLDKIVIASRERYAKNRLEVEDKIERWYNPANNTKMPSPIKTMPIKTKPVVSKKQTQPRVNNVISQGAYQPSKKQTLVSGNVDKSSQLNSNISIKAKTEVFNKVTKTLEVNNKNLKNSAVYKYTVKCSRCGAETKISFKPDGIRPVFCKECLSISREEKRKELEKRKKMKEQELKKISMEPIVAKIKTVNKIKEIRRNNNPIQDKKEQQTTKEKEISLGQVLQMNPVNFKGKEIVHKKESQNTQKESADNDVSLAPPVFKSTPKLDLETKKVKNNILDSRLSDKKPSFSDNEEEDGIAISTDETIDF